MNLRRSLGWASGQQATQFALGVVGSIAIARLLTPAEVGVFALAMSVSYLLGALRGVGVGLYLVREPKLDDAKIRTAFGIMIMASWLSGLILLLLAGPAARIYGEPAMVPVMSLLSVAFFIAPFGEPALSLLTREMRFDTLYRIASLSALAGTMISVALAASGFSYYALACGLIGSAAASALLALIHEPRHLRLRPSLRRWREVLRFGGLISGANLAATAAEQGTRFVLGALQGPAAVALYERSQSLSVMPGQALVEPLARAQTPAYAEAIRHGRPITAPVLSVTGATTATLWPLFAVIGALAVPLVVTIFGENWRTAGEILPFVLAAQALLVALPPPGVVLVPSGHLVRLLVLRLFQLLGAIALAVIGSSVSLELFARLLPLGAFLFVLAAYSAIRRGAGLSVRHLAPRYARALLIAAVAAVPAVVVRLWHAGDVPLSSLVGVAVSAPLLWLATLLVLRHELIDELWRVLRRIGAK